MADTVTKDVERRVGEQLRRRKTKPTASDVQAAVQKATRETVAERGLSQASKGGTAATRPSAPSIPVPSAGGVVIGAAGEAVQTVARIPASIAFLFVAGGAVLLWIGLTGGGIAMLKIPSLYEATGGFLGSPPRSEAPVQTSLRPVNEPVNAPSSGTPVQTSLRPVNQP